VDAAVVCF